MAKKEISPQTQETESKRVRVVPFSNGFTLEAGSGRPVVDVVLTPTYWQILSTESSDPFNLNRFGLFEIHRLVHRITSLSTASWEPPGRSWTHWRVRKWATDRASRPIAWLVRKERQRLLPMGVDPRVYDTQRAVFAACFGSCQLAESPWFYRHASRFLLDDIRRCRAAAIAVKQASRILSDSYPSLFADNGSNADRSEIIRRWCERLICWRDVFSDTQTSYRALNQTLDQLPGGVPCRLVCQLPQTHLRRPIADRLELTALLLCMDGAGGRHERVFHFSRRDEILRAMRIVSDAIRRRLSPRRTVDVGDFVNYVCDYPELHTGNVVGLAEHAVRYHREVARAELAAGTVAAIADVVTLHLPPVDPPVIPGLTFLGTAGEVRAEAIAMRHCIESYIAKALSGQCFLFHFEADGEAASIEVDWSGRVRQSCGPRNVTNVASKKARRLLSRWGQSFPKHNAEAPLAPPRVDV